MRELFLFGAVAAVLVLPAPAHAQFTLGARLGFAPGMGDATKGDPLKDTVKSQVPIQLDALYTLAPDVAAGLYFSYGLGQLGGAASQDCSASCSVRITRLGIEGTYTFGKADLPLVPWVGLGIGYEWQRLEASFAGISGTVTTSGFEFVNVQVGGDYRVGRQVAFGPYLLFSLGEYSSSDGHAIADTAIHEWLHLGVRATFDL